jgi:hypothetical protein
MDAESDEESEEMEIEGIKPMSQPHSSLIGFNSQ